MNVTQFLAQSIHDQIQNFSSHLDGKINRIKDLRTRTGLGLRESKECVEAWEIYGYRADRIDAIERVISSSIMSSPAPAPVEPPEDRRLVWATGYPPYEAQSKAEAGRFESWLRTESSPVYLDVRTYVQAND